MQTIDKFIDLIKQIDAGDQYVSPKDFAKKVKAFIEKYDDMALDGVLVSDHLEAIGKTFKKQMTDDAYAEYLLHNGEEKGEYMGFTITPTEGYYKYEYEQDDLIDKYEEELKELAKDLDPLLTKQKSLQDAIKNRQKGLVNEGRAKLISTTKSLRFERK